jgi:hypothetical protein
MTAQHADSALSCVWEECRQIFAVPERARGFLVLSLSLRTRLERAQGQSATGPSRHATSFEAVTLSRTVGVVHVNSNSVLMSAGVCRSASSATPLSRNGSAIRTSAFCRPGLAHCLSVPYTCRHGRCFRFVASADALPHVQSGGHPPHAKQEPRSGPVVLLRLLQAHVEISHRRRQTRVNPHNRPSSRLSFRVC